MSINLVLPVSTKNTSIKINTIDSDLNEKIKQRYQAINLIPIYKNISAKNLKKRTIFDKTPEKKNFNDSKESNNSSHSYLEKEKDCDLSIEDKNNKTNVSEIKKVNINSNSIDKKIRIPLQNLKDNIARNKIFSEKINQNKTKNKFSINFDQLKVNNLINDQILGKNKNETSNKFFKANLDKVRISKKSFGCIQGYAAITTEGIVRDFNEDRVSIILNIPQPQNFKGDKWPKCSFFGIYDGHGGSACADFLRDYLHKFVCLFIANLFIKKFSFILIQIISDPNFPENPQKAILNGFILAEKVFLQEALSDHSIFIKYN